MAMQWLPNQRDFGCTTGHTAYVYDRGGRRRLGVVQDIAQIQWGRGRDSVSEATVRIAMDDCAQQKDTLSKIEPKRTELVIYRGSERVWEGVVWRTTDHPLYFEIFAKDVLVYLFGTILSKKYSNRYPNTIALTTRIKQMIEYELQNAHTIPNRAGGAPILVPAWEQLDPPANILPFVQVHNFPNEAKTSDTTNAFQMTIGEYLQGKSRTGGIDFAAIGRAIHVWDTSRWIGQTRPLTSEDFDNDVIVSAYGADHTTFAYVTTEDGKWAVAGNPDAYYGPWTTVYPVYDEDSSAPPTAAELYSQASRNVIGRTPVPIEVRVPDNSTIRLGNDLGINDLVPGVRVPLTAKGNVREIVQFQKLQSMRVTENGESDESVQVTLTPATRPDSDDED